MKQLVESFPLQLSEALQIGLSCKLSTSKNPIQNVVISGLGGSGIGGTIVSQLLEYESPIPIIVNKKYFVPSFVGKNTLSIISSYSGNTEETIAAMHESIRKGAHIVCITSGGTIAEMAKKNNLDLILIPGGMPPRACLAYSLTQLLFVLKHFNLSNIDIKTSYENVIQLLDKDKILIQETAKTIAEKIYNKIPVIYSADTTEGIAVRFRQQLNENSKMLCWHHVLPEMNHNELVGWRTENKNLAVIIFKTPFDYERTLFRFEFTKYVCKQYTDTIIEIMGKGNNPLESALYLIHLGDWISVYAAELRSVDATEVNIITTLKSELAKNNE
jgi:glucose/mannose-6-phosphate isomerase